VIYYPAQINFILTELPHPLSKATRGEVEMRGILIIAGLVAIAYFADSYWNQGTYFAAVGEMASQVLRRFR
jgi:hypothetical protein